MKIEMESIGIVTLGRKDAVDDYWGDAKSTIELDQKKFSDLALKGLDSFSHIEVIFYFHQVEDSDVLTGSSHPRGNPDWLRAESSRNEKRIDPIKSVFRFVS